MKINLAFALILIMALVGCSSKEESARKMYNKALTLQQNKQFDEAEKIFQEIVRKYPETQTALEVNKELLAARIAEDYLKERTDETRKRTQEIIKEMLGESLDAFKLDNGRYPTTEEGLEALLTNKTKLPHWYGPYLKSPKYIGTFTYKREGEDYILAAK